MNLQWFPGHMAKARRMIEDNLKIIDVAAELIDARLPLSSRNPDFDSLLKNKPRLLIMNKADMADKRANAAWVSYFGRIGIKALCVSASTGEGMNQIFPCARKLLEEKVERDLQRGIHRTLKIMVAGIPNVGKSSLINRLTGKASTLTGDRPGVTRGKQWLRLPGGIELLDMPGVLWPKFDSTDVALKLAFTGAIKDEIMDIQELCCHLLSFLTTDYSANLEQRYKIECISGEPPDELLQRICKKRGFLMSGGLPDTLRGANIILDEFRGCKLGKITLEMPDKVSLS